MAAPIGHIYLALKMLAGPLNGIDEQAFLIGVSFPDIRYPAHLSRELTHVKNIDFKTILLERDPFRAGMLFHSFVDETREAFLKESRIQKLLPNIPHISALLKGVEDNVLFQELPDRSFLRYFDTILDQEKEIVRNEQIIRNWHTALQNYFFYGPTSQTIKPLLHGILPEMGILSGLAEQGAAFGFKIGTEIIALDQKIIASIKNFYYGFESIIV